MRNDAIQHTNIFQRISWIIWAVHATILKPLCKFTPWNALLKNPDWSNFNSKGQNLLCGRETTISIAERREEAVTHCYSHTEKIVKLGWHPPTATHRTWESGHTSQNENWHMREPQCSKHLSLINVFLTVYSSTSATFKIFHFRFTSNFHSS